MRRAPGRRRSGSRCGAPAGPQAGGLDRLDVARRGDRARDAGRPQLDVAPRALLQRPAADDVGEREPPSWAQHAGGLLEDAALDHGEVDHAVGDHDVEARVAERQPVDPRLDEVDLVEALAEPRGLVELLAREVDADDVAGRADLHPAQKTSVPEPEPRSSTDSPGSRPRGRGGSRRRRTRPARRPGSRRAARADSRGARRGRGLARSGARPPPRAPPGRTSP